MKKTFAFMACCIISIAVSGQNNFIVLADSANKALNDKKYKEAAALFSKVISVNGGKAGEHTYYNAACAWALAGHPDSAFVFLNKAANTYTNIGHITTDIDLKSLHNDKRWQTIISRIQLNEKAKQDKYGKIIQQIDNAYATDQFLRNIITVSIGPLYGFKSPQFDSANLALAIIDSINTIVLTKIINQYGWLGQQELGAFTNYKQSLIMQHAAPDTMRKYLPLMRDAFKAGKMSGRHIALVEDRVRMYNGEQQIYGTQVTIDKNTEKLSLYPIEDIGNVNKRRAGVGLEPLEEYLKQYGL